MNESAFWHQFGLYSKWSLEALTIPTVLLLFMICVASLVVAGLRQRPFRSGVWHLSHWLVLTQLLFFPATIAVGVLCPAASTGPYAQANIIGSRWLDSLFGASLVTGCFWVYRIRGLRWFAASLVGLQEVLILCAGFIAGMSVSGQWL